MLLGQYVRFILLLWHLIFLLHYFIGYFYLNLLIYPFIFILPLRFKYFLKSFLLFIFYKFIFSLKLNFFWRSTQLIQIFCLRIVCYFNLIREFCYFNLMRELLFEVMLFVSDEFQFFLEYLLSLHYLLLV